MNKICKIIIGTCIVMGCTKNNERSGIEIIKLDTNMVRSIKASYDSAYIETPKREDFWTIEHYLSKPATDKKIFKDALNNIVTIVINTNGIVSFSQEYYPNGQAKAKTDFSPGKIDGPATYYYEDGRIRSKGTWSDYKQVGVWKEYDKDGYLVLTQYYNENGVVEKEEK